MHSSTNVEKLFTVLDETAEIIKKELDCTYIESVAETGENLFHGDVLQESISEVSRKKLLKHYQNAHLNVYSNEEIRKAYQLAVLKGLKEASHPNHQMTPDTVGLFLSYLINKFVKDHNKIRLLDPAVGTGNLLTTVLNHLHHKQIQANGIDVDDLLLKLALVGANLQKHPIEFFHQDSLEPLFVDPVDMTICDLPVGYYPNDVGAQKFQLKADEGHSYAHHLFIEQSLKYTKPGGYLFFLIPNNLFETKEAPKLHKFIKENAIILGLLQLPLSLFKKGDFAKSIFILQKKSKHAQPPKQALLVELPKFTNKRAMSSIINQIDKWFKENMN
ncbi:class I SAM-dependent methyltransferase [Aeribacillus alveayuensis]|uniref:Site-specific DNA-methyltransferase (Adenine-specific) n=1 Tax=Aeribacillus alveayuensis TaxID=279215 RepID=A0ABT9VJB4_9BACI|nr:site-specific DNA-methyltransferase (adenine-specific) [Bacillus alveayuensis]